MSERLDKGFGVEVSDAPPLTKDKIADLWVSHSDKLWRTVFATPIIAITVIAAWFALMSDGYVIIARFVLTLGMAVFGFMFLIISRMAQFDGALYSAIKSDLPPVVAPRFGISGKTLAEAIPVMIGLILLCLFPIYQLPTQ